MQRQFTDKKLTAEEHIKNAGLILDFDEIARKGGMSKEEVLIAKGMGFTDLSRPATIWLGSLSLAARSLQRMPKPSRRWQTNIPAVKFP
ncbi:MAG: hypothetical protein ACYSTW_10160 [Planctomycetota bacterium]|jgi:hypothetical protein